MSYNIYLYLLKTNTMIKKLIKEGKEALVAKWVNSQIEDYGIISDLEIDTLKKIVCINLQLKGEKETFKVTFINYEIKNVEDETFIYIEEIKTEREWLDLLLTRYIDNLLPQKRIKLPNNLVKIVVKLLL